MLIGYIVIQLAKVLYTFLGLGQVILVRFKPFMHKTIIDVQNRDTGFVKLVSEKCIFMTVTLELLVEPEL